ncbi:MAG: GFA family protein [Motiliproteus sp.]|nr:GFA family protein [Motiliproteus sp.]MCW9052099.1 GFA family protein [Motiliproteus sp.]
MADFKGSCHCGAVTFSFQGEGIEKGLRCTCSICTRKGALMSAFVIPEEQLNFDADNEALSLYQFGTQKAKHFFCRHCGIYTFHETMRMPGQYRVNLGCIEGLDSISLPWDIFDGKNLM